MDMRQRIFDPPAIAGVIRCLAACNPPVEVSQSCIEIDRAFLTPLQ